DVVLAGYIEPPVRVWNDLLMDVAVGAADVHVRAGVVGNQSRVVTTPRARQVPGRLDARRIARTERQCRRRKRERRFTEQRALLRGIQLLSRPSMGSIAR